MKRLVLLLLSAAMFILVGCNGQKEMKVMSFNVRMGVAEDGDNSWEFRKEAFPAMLDSINPAVFGVQEAFDFQVNYIKEKCPRYSSIGVGRDDGMNDGEQMAVFYNKNLLKLIDSGTYWLSETPDVPSFGWDAACRRTATWTRLKFIESGYEFFFVNTHLDHRGKEARKNGLALIVDKIAAMNPENLPMILTGDFNMRPDDQCLEDLDQKMLSARKTAEDSDTKGSFNNWGKRSEIIDYIYYSGFEKCSDFKVVDQQWGDVPFISDHYPVAATLIFK